MVRGAVPLLGVVHGPDSVPWVCIPVRAACVSACERREFSFPINIFLHKILLRKGVLLFNNRVIIFLTSHLT